MKEITIYATSIANIDPNRTGYRLSMADPDAASGKPLVDRTFASGYAVPLKVTVPDQWTVAETQSGETFLWHGDTAMHLAWYHRKGIVAAWPVATSLDEATQHGAVVHLKSQKSSEVG